MHEWRLRALQPQRFGSFNSRRAPFPALAITSSSCLHMIGMLHPCPQHPLCPPPRSPLVFDLSLKVGVSADKDADGWHILHVYGSPNADDLSSDGTIMKASGAVASGAVAGGEGTPCLELAVVLCSCLNTLHPSCKAPPTPVVTTTHLPTAPLQVNTLFPAPKVNGSIKGGVVLLRMKRPDKADTPLELSVSYVDRQGQKYRWDGGRSTGGMGAEVQATCARLCLGAGPEGDCLGSLVRRSHNLPTFAPSPASNVRRPTAPSGLWSCRQRQRMAASRIMPPLALRRR